jgi:hypothetical protein
MATINFGSSISLQEFVTAVHAVGPSVTIIGEGEMGIGKSSMLKVLSQRMPGHLPAYIDCTLLDLGDFALPYTVEENGIKVTRFAPNARFRFHEGKPVIVMLDEIGKAMKAVKNVLLTLMLEHRIGDHYLPEGSVVFGTTNLMSEGVGDMLEAHARNRVAKVRIRKSDADEWIDDYAIDNGIAPEVIAWVKQYPHCLAPFDDPAQRDNPYLNQPSRGGQQACVTPRSLEKASYTVKQRAVLGENLTIAMLAGTIGEAAARDMQAFLTVADKLPTWEAVQADPSNTKLPDDTVAKCIMVFAAIARVGKDSLTNWMTYMQRMDKEWQALFAKSVMRAPGKQAFCVTNKAFKDWAVRHEYLY